MNAKETAGLPATYREPRQVVFDWMDYYLKVENRLPTVRELAESSGVSKTRAGEHRKSYLENHIRSGSGIKSELVNKI